MKGEGFLSKNISGFSRALESVIIAEDSCRGPGLLQGLDPRIKVITFLFFIVTVGLARSLVILGVIFFLILVFSLLSRISLRFFLKRILLFIPIFTAVIALPALFITPGEPLLSVAGKTIITEQGAHTAGLLLLRVTDSLSFGVLLILTTPWMSILVALRWLHVPSLVVDILGMTYRYIFLLLHTTNSMFLARRSRTMGNLSGGENRRWLFRVLVSTMAKSQHISEEVYLAMLSRGYQGEVRILSNLNIKRRDFLWVAFTAAVVSILLWRNTL